jgi:preprotein translocase subunit SecY
MGVQKHYQKRFAKQETGHVEKFLQKIRPKIQNRLFQLFLGFVYRVLGRISVRGVQKHQFKKDLKACI